MKVGGPPSNGTGQWETGGRDAEWRGLERVRGGGCSLADDKRTEGEGQMPWTRTGLSAGMESRTACGGALAEEAVRI